jgi:hypothetical protein
MRTNLARLVVSLGMAAVITAGMAVVGATSASATGLTPPIWTVRSNPNPPNASETSLGSVSCVGTSFCVAVGNSSIPGPRSTLAETWNGTGWTIAPSPNPSGVTDAELTGVSCTSTSACMAVGWSSGSSGPDEPLAEAWNGSAWSIVTVPAPVAGGTLSGISCVGPSKCFAVGEESVPAPSPLTDALIEEWNGSVWTPSGVSGSPYQNLSLSGVSCSGPDACLAVGDEAIWWVAGGVSSSGSFAERWNGLSWSPVPPANVLWYPTYLTSVSCIGPSSCTAVGFWQASPYPLTLVETWNGSNWAIVPSPNGGEFEPESSVNELSGVSCSSPAFCAAVGFVEGSGSGTGTPYSLIETWNGASWVIGTPQALGPPLLGASCTAALACTAVGGQASPGGSQLSAVVSTNGQVRPSRVVGMESNPSHPGYREVGSDGSVATFGSSVLGSLGGAPLNQPIVGIASTPSGNGYWEVAADGGIFSYGDARFYGSTGDIHLNQPVVGMASTPDGKGYWEVASDGGIFAFGDARFYGSTGDIRLNQPVVGMASTPDGKGYWLVAADGGIFAYGDAPFLGSWR